MELLNKRETDAIRSRVLFKQGELELTKLEKRLAERNLKILHKEVINGVHAGKIYRIETRE